MLMKNYIQIHSSIVRAPYISIRISQISRIPQIPQNISNINTDDINPSQYYAIVRHNIRHTSHVTRHQYCTRILHSVTSMVDVDVALLSLGCQSIKTFDPSFRDI